MTDSFPTMTVTLAPNMINYVGDFYLDMRADSLPNVAKLSTKIIKRPGYTVAMQFGLLGALVYEATKGDALVHTFTVETDSAFAPSKPLPWQKAVMSVDCSRPAPKK